MTPTRRSRFSPAAWIVPAALLLPLVLVAALIVHGRRAEAAQKALVRRALADYSGIAAWQFAHFAERAIHSAAMQVLPGDCMMCGGASGNGPTATSLALGTFKVDGTGATATFDGAMFDHETKMRVVRNINAMFRWGSNEPHRVYFDTIGGAERAVVLSLGHQRGGAYTVYGAIADPALFQARLDSMIEKSDLLPEALVHTPLRRDQVRVRIATAEGRYLFTVGSSPGSDITATDTLSREAGRLRATLALDSSVGSLLRLPSSGGYPLAMLVGLSILAGGLAVVALVHLRRSRELARAREQFVANVSHELRTPLTHISMFAETLMLGRERSGDERRHFASVIHREARRLTNLVDGVLRFARVDAGRDSLDTASLDAAAEIREALDTFQPMLAAAACRLETNIPAHVTVSADSAALRQIVTNLLDNAVKYGPHGQTVRVTLAPADDWATLIVADEGPGIRADDRERVFEPFTRLVDGRPRVAGAGIGLALVKDLVARMGGVVGIDDHTGGGAAVWVRLPRRATRAANAPALAEPSSLVTR